MRELVLAFVCAGCSAPLTHGQPPETLKERQIHVGVAMGGHVSTGVISFVDEGVARAKQFADSGLKCEKQDGSDCLKASQFDKLVASLYGVGIGGAAGPVSELQVAYGLHDRLQVGGRLFPGGQRLDVAWQAWKPADAEPNGLRGLLMLSASRQSAPIPGILEKVTDWLKLQEFGRKNLDLSLSAGGRMREFGWWGVGGRYMVSHMELDLTPGVKYVDDVTKKDTFEVSNTLKDALPGTDETFWAHQYGGFAHLFAGYKYVWAGLEVTATWWTASPSVLGERYTLSGLAIQPSLVLFGRF